MRFGNVKTIFAVDAKLICKIMASVGADSDDANHQALVAGYSCLAAIIDLKYKRMCLIISIIDQQQIMRLLKK